jgi:hypothetical protein
MYRLENTAPLPTLCCSPMRHCQRDRAVAEQPARPVLVRHAHGLAQQQAAKAGTVDEQVALDLGTRIEPERGDVAAGRIGAHGLDLAFDAAHPEALAEAAQEARVQAGVQVVSVVHAAARQVGEAALLRGAQLETVIAVVAGQAALAALEPEVLEARGPVVGAGQAERMDVVLAHVAPVLEADAKLERGLGRGHELLLVDLKQLVEVHQGRDGGLANADGADRVRFDQRDLEPLAERFGDAGSGHPAGGAATGDDDAPYRFAIVLLHLELLQRFSLLSRCARRLRVISSSSGPSARRAAGGMCAAVASPASNT